LKQKNAILFFIVLGAVLLSVGLLLFAWVLQLYGTQGRIVTNSILLSMFSILFGIPILTVGLTLYVVTKTNE
jgi:hypothetical protein